MQWLRWVRKKASEEYWKDPEAFLANERKVVAQIRRKRKKRMAAHPLRNYKKVLEEREDLEDVAEILSRKNDVMIPFSQSALAKA